MVDLDACRLGQTQRVGGVAGHRSRFANLVGSPDRISTAALVARIETTDPHNGWCRVEVRVPEDGPVVFRATRMPSFRPLARELRYGEDFHRNTARWGWTLAVAEARVRAAVLLVIEAGAA